MNSLALHTDLYQITMMAAYFHNGRAKNSNMAICEMFVRRMPKNRRFMVAAGLADVIDYLENLRFTDSQIEFLRSVPSMRKVMTVDFVEYLRSFRFTGSVRAVPEGTILFQNEPFIQIVAPLIEAQLVETFILSKINYQTMIASKAARVVLAAKGRPVLEFGTRRTNPEAAIDVARASYIAGFEGTSNVEAAYRHDIPVRGTMAHMFVMASGSEEEAFSQYGKVFERSTYLVDTYDTLNGVRTALRTLGENISAVRLDSGDLASLSKEVRNILKEEGREDVKIMLSSDLDEYELQKLNESGDFDGAGVGTRLATSDDSPSLGGVYKLVQINSTPVAKFSESKVTYPGGKQVYREMKDGLYVRDFLGYHFERSYDYLNKTPLLASIMQDGKITYKDSIHRIRQRVRDGLNSLPEELKIIDKTDDHVNSYQVVPSERLLDLLEKCRKNQVK